MSPSSVSLEGLPPLLIEVGECECLRDQILAFIARAKAAGVEIEDHLAPGMVHVFPLFAAIAEAGTPPHLAFDHLSSFLDRTVGPLLAEERQRFPSRCKTCRRALTYWKHFTCSTTMIAAVVLILLLVVLKTAAEVAGDDDKDLRWNSTTTNGTMVP